MRLIYLLLILTIPFKVSAQIKPADQQYIPMENLLVNPGFEQGRTAWVGSGTATRSLEQSASLVLSGVNSFKIVASSQTFELSQSTTKSALALAGMDAIAMVRIRTNHVGIQVCAVENSVHTNCVDVNPNNETKEYVSKFVFNSTSNGIVIKGPSGTGTTYIDDAYVGVMPATMMPEVSQAQILAFSQYGTSCSFLKTTAGFANFSNVSACDSTPRDVVSNFSGSLVLADTDNLIFTLNNMPAGDYDVIATISRVEADASGELGCVRVSDGTISGAGSCHVDNNTGAIGGVTAKLQFSISSTTSKTFSLQGSDINAISATNSTNDAARVNWIVRYYPPKSKIYSQQCTSSLDCENVFSAYVSDSGVVSGENLDWINGSCSISSTNIFTCPFNAGAFSSTPVCSATALQAAATNGVIVQLNSATSSQLVYSTNRHDASVIAYGAVIRCQKSSPDFKEKNVITGTFANVVTAPNIAKPKTCYYAFGGASATLASPTECTASPCVEVVDTCSAGTAPTRSATGAYNDLTFANGTWKANTLISCKCFSFDVTSGSLIRACNMMFVTGDNTWATNSNGGYVGNVLSSDAGLNTTVDSYNLIECTADAP